MSEATCTLFAETMEKYEEGPEFVRYLQNRDISNHKNDPNMATKVLATMKRKECRTCKKKLEHVRRCSKCRVAAYCDTSCQKVDYPVHKTTCSVEAMIKAVMKDSRASVGVFQQ